MAGMSETNGADGAGVEAVTNREDGRRDVVRSLQAAFSTNASETLLRERFAQLAGLQYGKDRDVYKVAGYPDSYTFAEGWSRYKRQDIARRVVDLPVSKTWKHRPEIMDGDDPEAETEFTTAWDALWGRLKLSAQFERADRMASIGEFSILLLGLADKATDTELSQPVDPLTSPDDVLFVRPYKQSDVQIQEFETRTDSERFGHPVLYRVALSGGDTQFRAASALVHQSRILHIVEDPLDSDVYGVPRLERVLNRLIDLEKIAASTGEAYWQIAVRILVASIDPKVGIDSDVLEDLDDDMEDLVHNLRRFIAMSGMTLDQLGGETPDPEEAANLMFVLIAAAMGIPKRVLIGTETGERASQQDERAFLGSVVERIEQYAEPTVVRGFTDRMIELGALPAPSSGEYTLVWPDLYEASEAEEAETDKARAETAKALVPVGGNPLDVSEITEEGRVVLRQPDPIDDPPSLPPGTPDGELEDAEGDGAA